MSHTALLTPSKSATQESGLTPGQFEQMAAAGLVSVHPRIVSGAVVFAGTRVPVYNLWDYLRAGDSLEDFLDSFPTVRREQAQEAIQIKQRTQTREAALA